MTRLLTVEEVAERLGVTKDWVWAQARAGRIPHVQLGRYRRFREEALDRWLEDLELRSATANGRRSSEGLVGGLPRTVKVLHGKRLGRRQRSPVVGTR
jgi:excisionase family DNA binding protein